MVNLTSQSIKKSEERKVAPATNERASGKEKVLCNKKETIWAGEVALFKTVHGDVKEVICGTISATMNDRFSKDSPTVE